MTKLAQFILIALVLIVPRLAPAQQVDALIDELVSNGTLTNTQAEHIRAKLSQEYAQTPAGKIELDSNSIRKLQFYGDGRLRFENIDQQNHNDANNIADRERYRIRIGALYTYSDHFQAGFELESGETADSNNQTFGGMFSKSSINVGKIFLKYSPTDWITAEAGKFANPWYENTDMVYATNLNPEGAAEILTFHPTDHLTVGLTAAQYIYVHSNQSTSTPNINNNNVGIIGEQIPVTWKITDKVSVKVAPGFTFYTGGGNNNYGTSVVTGTTTSSTAGVPPGGSPAVTTVPATPNSTTDPVFVSPREADDLNIVSAPGEIDFTAFGVPIRPYWDFDWNVTGKERIQHVYLDATASAPAGATAKAVAAAVVSAQKQNQALGDNLAWAAGVQVGTNKKKGDWSVLGEFRQIGLGAVDQNINGTDFADSYANQEGVKLSGIYNLTDFLTGTVTYYNTWDYKNNLYQALGGGSGTPTVGTTQALISEKALQRVQVDLDWKF